MRRPTLFAVLLACLILSGWAGGGSSRAHTNTRPSAPLAGFKGSVFDRQSDFFNLSLLPAEMPQWRASRTPPEGVPAAGLKAGAAAVAAAVGDCEMECNNQYAACAEYECGSPTAICSPCIEQQNQCLDACPESPPPPCPTTQSYETERQLTGQQYLGRYCLRGYYSYSPTYHDRMGYVYRDTTYLVTRDCRGNVVSKSYVSSSTSRAICDYDTHMSCHYPEGYSYCGSY